MTYLTFVGLVTRVNSQMIDEIALFVEGLITFSTNKYGVQSVSFAVDLLSHKVKAALSLLDYWL